MKLNKIKLCVEASERLKYLKSRTGLTPNILCRIGFCLSLRENGLPNADVYPEDGQEFNRYTLTGEWDLLFVALLKQRCVNDSNSRPEVKKEVNVNRDHLYREQGIRIPPPQTEQYGTSRRKTKIRFTLPNQGTAKSKGFCYEVSGKAV